MDYDDTGMVKLIYSSAFDKAADVHMEIIEDVSQLNKSAATVFGCESEALKPDDDHVGIHVVALGDWETYGSNRNGDTFPKKACLAYHDTFVKNGALFRHHRNKDRNKNLGALVKSAYNEPMGRVELFVHAHKERARDELHRLSKEGEIPFSMACKVAFDRCNTCGNLRRNARDPNQCEHVVPSLLGKLAEDGSVYCTHNDEPNYFDLSFVGRPADRIAWDLKVASGDTLDSVKLAQVAGLWVPEHLAVTSPQAIAKLELLKKLAHVEAEYAALVERGRPVTAGERYYWHLPKAASTKLDDTVIEQLRAHEPDDVFAGLSKIGVVLDVDSFYKYAFGTDYGDVAPYMDGVRRAVRTVFSHAVKTGETSGVCNERIFDVDSRDARLRTLGAGLVSKAASATAVGPEMEQRIVDGTIAGTKNEMALDNNTKVAFNGDSTMSCLAAKYAAYKLAAVIAVLDQHQNTDNEALHAYAVAQNLA
jgi:hypothetical protein